MKQAAGVMCLASFYAGALWTEYHLALLLGSSCFLLIGGSALFVLTVALRRAPEGYERADGFRIRRARQTPSVLPAVRPPRRQLRRGWT